MNLLRLIDLGFQSLVIGLAIVLAAFWLFTGEFESIGEMAVYVALVIGPWQLVSSLVNILSRDWYFRQRLIHLLSSLSYLAFAGLFSNSVRWIGSEKTLALGIYISIPAALALFYYWITYNSVRQSQRVRPKKI